MPRIARQLTDDGWYHVLTRGAYVDLNPVRARIVRQPQDYPWSSARAYLRGTRDPLVTPNPGYLSLGRTSQERQGRYQQFLTEQLRQPVLAATAAGSTAHLRQLAPTAGTALPLKARGRPRKLPAAIPAPS